MKGKCVAAILSVVAAILVSACGKTTHRSAASSQNSQPTTTTTHSVQATTATTPADEKCGNTPTGAAPQPYRYATHAECLEMSQAAQKAGYSLGNAKAWLVTDVNNGAARNGGGAICGPTVIRQAPGVVPMKLVNGHWQVYNAVTGGLMTIGHACQSLPKVKS